MRPLFLFSLALALASAAHAADVAFVRVWPQWRDAEAFDRIGGYFGGGEGGGATRILRTQPGALAGYYFLVRVANADAISDAKFTLQIIRPDAPEPKSFSFAAALPAKGTVFELGLTGTDWPGGKTAHPVAWRLALLAADGRLLAEQKSFLWEKPAK